MKKYRERTDGRHFEDVNLNQNVITLLEGDTFKLGEKTYIVISVSRDVVTVRDEFFNISEMNYQDTIMELTNAYQGH